MQEEKRRFSPPVVGGSSLLVIFAVLCLTVFALLSMSTVQADSRLADSSARAVAGYYEADTRAETTLAALRAGTVPPGVEVDGTVYRYSCPISETQALFVEVSFPEGPGGGAYSILRWQAASVADWEPDDNLLVWDGEFPD